MNFLKELNQEQPTNNSILRTANPSLNCNCTLILVRELATRNNHNVK